MDKLVICVTGMPGSGKSMASNILRNTKYKILVMGDEIREEAKLRNIPPTTKNLGELMIQIRREGGPGVLARKCINKINSFNTTFFVIDGVRSLSEVSVFREDFPKLGVIAIHSSPLTRFNRLTKRGRSDDSGDWKKFLERDNRELRVGLGDVIATADYIVINEGTKTEFKNSLYKTIRQLEKSQRNYDSKSNHKSESS